MSSNQEVCGNSILITIPSYSNDSFPFPFSDDDDDDDLNEVVSIEKAGCCCRRACLDATDDELAGHGPRDVQLEAVAVELRPAFQLTQT